MSVPEPAKARRGVWTPWAQILCVACDYEALQSGEHQQSSVQTYLKHFQKLETMDRSAEVACDDGELLASCDVCLHACWTRLDVALLQQVGLLTSTLVWEEGPFGWELEQTGGMCAALVFTTAESYGHDRREIVVTAMDGEIFIGEYAKVLNEDERWMEALRTWVSEELYGERGALKSVETLTVLVDQCARKVIEFVYASSALCVEGGVT